ncbi:hypothetical protein [Chitinophaga ginsengisoli]|uniref:Uncharacterized protein n=1 Tax=Chitinophaga ginsengisoli TaxID=363837 RepID=A0A2P8FDZ1_9BACT|nr:hypothetical protein [Chitinophaga ginsengisoli]PSL19942.1 hypothetical protein CLV42_12655 [Chitinophaga ginsengisoli]
MKEEELMRLGFFEIESTVASANTDVRRFQLYECYNDVFLRIIISMHKDNFIVEHMYFNSPESDELKLELFGSDLSVENIINRLKAYRESIDPSKELPETF